MDGTLSLILDGLKVEDLSINLEAGCVCVCVVMGASRRQHGTLFKNPALHTVLASPRYNVTLG